VNASTISPSIIAHPVHRVPFRMLSLALFLAASAAPIEARQWGNTAAQEYGDPVYRDFGIWPVEAYGHAAIFYGVDYSDVDKVIHMDGSNIAETSLQNMIGNKVYWGAYQSTNSSHRPDQFSERSTIIEYADALKSVNPDFPWLGADCINPVANWGTIMQPDEVDEIRCDGVVEYCYEYGTDFPVWGQYGTKYDISKYYEEHNNLYQLNPNKELAPLVQCGRAGGYSTYMTNSASVDFPDRNVTATYYSDRTVVTMRASDQSGIHRIRYKWGSNGSVQSYVYGQHPTSDYREVQATTYSTSNLYFWNQDGAGNDDGYWHIYLITVNQPPNTPYNEDPYDSETGVSRTANLDWSCTDPDGDTIYYTVWLSKGNNTFSSSERIKIDATGSYADAGTMDYDSHYYWKVQADDHNGGVTTVSHWDFYVESAPNSPPNTPYNESPSDGATGVSRTANLDWSCTDPDGDTIYYTVWLSKGNNTFSSSERIKIDTTGSHADPGTMDYGAHYYWKVQADDHNGGVTTVSHWDFYTESGPPPIPGSISYPSSDSDGVYSISWASSSGATSYQLQRSNNSGSSWAQIYSGANTSHGENVGNGSYRYRVKATNSAGSSGWRTGTHDCVVSGPPTPPTGASADHDDFCDGDYTHITLTATGGSGETLKWYSQSCGGTYVATGSPSPPIPAPSQTTTYFARWESTGHPASSCASVAVIVHAPPTAPTGAHCDVSFYCVPVDPDLHLTLTATGGSGDHVEWHIPQGLYLGSGNPLVIGPLDWVPNAGYFEFQARWVTDQCGASDFASVSVGVGHEPSANAYNTGPVCEGEEVWLYAQPNQMDSYEWIGPNGFHEFGQSVPIDPSDPSMSGGYTVIVTFEGCQNWGGTNVVIYPRPDTAPLYLTPLEGEACVSPAFPLEWQSVSDAGSYDVYWGDSSPPPFWQNASATTASPPALEEVQYFWQVVARNDNDCEGPPGPIWSYTTEASPDIHDRNILWGSAVDDRFGIDVDLVGDVDGDGFPDYIIGAERERHGGQQVGGAQVRSGVDGSLIHHVTGNQPDSRFGTSVSGAGHVDGDQFPEFIVGAPWDSTNGTNAGSAMLFSGRHGTPRHIFYGTSPGSQLGSSVDGLGDLNGDGTNDLLIASDHDSSVIPGAGMVQAFSGADWSVIGEWRGSSIDEGFGGSIAGGVDLDDDGVPDILIGSIGDDTNGLDTGSVTVISGATGLSMSWSPLLGSQVEGRFGTSVAFAGDVTGDGVQDILVGIHHADHNGAHCGAVRVYSGADGSEYLTVYGLAAGDQLGFRVAGVGDVDGDGRPDFAAGGAGCDTTGNNAGRVAVFSGLDGSLLKEYFGDGLKDNMFAVACVGDINFDGNRDLVIGAYQAGNGGRGYARVVSISCLSSDGIGVPICFGDGSGIACPCNNTGGPGEGCANGTGSGGVLSATGSASVSANDLVLQASGVVPSQPGLYFQGALTAGNGVGEIFGDGLRCAGGQVIRIGVSTADGAGNSSISVNVATLGGVLPGDSRVYQLWYRDPVTSPCGFGFNLTNGYRIAWKP
jgi:hypothetical protein